MLTQAIAAACVIAFFGGAFMVITVVRNNYMDKVNPKNCQGKENGMCATCPSICDDYRNELYQMAIDEIAGKNKADKPEQ